jgi:hypothetical protein
MAAWVLIGMLAAFGLLCAGWAVFGWLLSGGSGGYIVCPDLCDSEGRSFLRRYLWLRGMGLLKCPVYVSDQTLSDREKKWLEAKGIELYCPEQGRGIGAETN